MEVIVRPGVMEAVKTLWIAGGRLVGRKAILRVASTGYQIDLNLFIAGMHFAVQKYSGELPAVRAQANFGATA
jgi:hypothetical protein